MVRVSRTEKPLWFFKLTSWLGYPEQKNPFFPPDVMGGVSHAENPFFRPDVMGGVSHAENPFFPPDVMGGVLSPFWGIG